MTIDVYTSAGVKKGTATLPKALFEAPINEGLMHQAVVMQQSNGRKAIAHVKTRGEVQGSTKKLYQQKGTGRARRGSVRSPLLKGGGKIFGPRSDANFVKNMPKKMRRTALFSCLSWQAKNKSIIGLDGLLTDVKTKKAHEMLAKLPVELGRRILVVLPKADRAMTLSLKNIPNVKVIQAAYLNPEDVLTAKHMIFHIDALNRAEEVFVGSEKNTKKASKKTEDSPAVA